MVHGWGRLGTRKSAGSQALEKQNTTSRDPRESVNIVDTRGPIGFESLLAGYGDAYHGRNVESIPRYGKKKY